MGLGWEHLSNAWSGLTYACRAMGVRWISLLMDACMCLCFATTLCWLGPMWRSSISVDAFSTTLMLKKYHRTTTSRPLASLPPAPACPSLFFPNNSSSTVLLTTAVVSASLTDSKSLLSDCSLSAYPSPTCLSQSAFVQAHPSQGRLVSSAFTYLLLLRLTGPEWRISYCRFHPFLRDCIMFFSSPP